MIVRRFVSACLVVVLLRCVAARGEWPPPRPIDDGRLAAVGLRVVRSEHATLVTDVESSPAIDRLPRLVDFALPQWAQRFGLRPAQTERWRVRIYLVDDEARFRSRGLWPDQSEDFPNGLSLGYEVWVRQQRTDYYRRCLVLHEATHSVMSTLLGGCGPGWYMEGIAELCGAHAWDPDTEELRLAVIPERREAAPDWGRVRLVREAIDARGPRPLDAVLTTDNRVVLSTEAYAWTWALVALLDGHPRYRDRFAKLSGWVTSPAFDRRVQRVFARDRRRLEQEWRLFAATLAYGHDVEREAIVYRAGKPLADGETRSAMVRADRGWQSSGVAVRRDTTYRISASGRFEIGQEPDGAPWPCEAGGVTLDYHAGRPVGELMATIDDGSPNAFTRGEPIGLGKRYMASESGTLYLRVNDAPDSLVDNAGSLRVEVR